MGEDFEVIAGEDDEQAANEDLDGKLQQIIMKLKKNAQQNQNINNIQQEIAKEIIKEEIIGKNEAKIIVHGKTLILCKRSLFIFNIKSFLRNLAIMLVEWKWFERFIIFAIFISSIFLAVYDYQDKNDTSQRNQVINGAGSIFLYIFSAECVLKILSYGFLFHKNAYLRDGWNWLDFTVVVIGWMELIPDVPGLRALRTLRVLRPLRSINAIPSMKNQISSLISSFGQLVNVLLFLMFLFIIFGILGVQLYQGQLYQRCRLTEAPDQYGNWPIDPNQIRPCQYPDTAGWYYCNEGTYCGSPSDYNLTLDNDNLTLASDINFGITTFDNLAIGMLTIFQCLTLEGWSDIMYMFMDSGTPWLGAIYFIFLAFIGSFFLLNIILVVIITNYGDTKQKQKDEALKFKKDAAKLEKAELKREESRLKIQKEAEEAENTGQANHQNEDIIPYQSTRVGEIIQVKRTLIQVQDQSLLEDQNEQELEISRGSSLNDLDREQTKGKVDPILPVIDINEKKFQSTFYELDWGTVNKAANEDEKRQQRDLKASVAETEKNKSIIDIVKAENEVNFMTPPDAERIREQVKEEQKYFSVIPFEMKPLESKQKSLQTVRTSNLDQSEMKTAEPKSPRNLVKSAAQFWTSFRRFFYITCNSGLFSMIIMMLIVLNTVVLAMDKHPQDMDLSDLLNKINNALTWLFFAEMVIKLIGLGPKLYIKDRFNIFDAFVTTLTIGENLLDLAGPNSISTGGSISGLRAIRLFRIFKLARNLKSFQEMLQKIYMSIGDIGNFSVLLFLFLFTYTLFGMELYSDKIKFDSKGNVDLVNGQSVRENFDTFIQGFISIFLVLIGDNWNNNMYNAILCNGTSTALFYIFLQTFGKYVLLNLFLAIILENFEDQPAEGDSGQTQEAEQPKKKPLGERMKLKLISFKSKLVSLFTFNQAKVAQLDLTQLHTNSNIAGLQNNDNTFKPLIGQNLDSFRSSKQNNSGRKVAENPTARPRDQSTPFTKKDKSFNKEQLELILNSPNKTSKLKRMQSVKSDIDDGKFDQIIGANVTGSPKKMSHTQSKFFPTGSPPNAEPPIAAQGSQYQTENDEFLFEGQGSGRELLISMKKQSSTVSKSRGKKKNLMEDLIDPTVKIKSKVDVILLGRSLFIFSKTNPIRLFLLKVVTHRAFDPFILFLILFSTILLTIDNPLNDPDGTVQTVLGYIDIVVTILFSCEALFKIILYGLLLNGPDSYLRNSWNVMDIIIVVFSILSLSLSSLNIQFIKVIRMLRVLRPLRMISRNEGLKIAVLSLINAVHGIVNASVISLIFFILFGIFGVNQFKGKFNYCYNNNISPIFTNEDIVTKWDCLDMGGEWMNQVTNFDNLLISMLSLFVCTTTEGWEQYMYHGSDSVDIDYNPQYESSLGWSFFFIVFMVVGSEFVLNLFVSIIVDTYYIEKEKLSQNQLLAHYQKQWILAQNLCLTERPIKVSKKLKKNKVSLYCERIAEHPLFDGFIIGCIIVNTILMTLNWYQSPAQLGSIMDAINYGFTAIFTLEAIIKIIAFRLDYFKQGWNVFDFTIVLISYITLIIGLSSSASVGPKQTTIARAFRIGRVFRLIKKAKFLRIIFNTIILTLPSLANVGGLLILLLFIFAILGTQLFATVTLQTTLNHHKNFQNFGMAFFTLIVIQTGEGWNFVMEDCARGNSIIFQCDSSPDYNSIQANGGVPNGCGSPITSFMYFFFFQLIVSIIFLNLFIAVILQGFSSSKEEEGLEVHRKQAEQLKDLWKKYDPDGTGYILTGDLSNLIDEIEEHTEIIKSFIKKDPLRRRKFIASLQIPTYFTFTKYYFQDILSCLVKKYLQYEYVIEELKLMEIEDPLEYIHFFKEIEEQYEHVIDDINKKAKDNKIQMVEKNFRQRNKYSKKMVNNVDKMEDKVFDSSYIVWVPVIQERLKPFIRKIKERRRLLAGLEPHRGLERNPTLIMETGGQLGHDRAAIRTEEDVNSENNNNFNSNGRFMNDQTMAQEQIENWPTERREAKKRAQNTGEIGGTHALSQDDESFEQEYENVIQEEMNQNNSQLR